MARVVWERAGEEHWRRIDEGQVVLVGRSRACGVSYAHPSLSKRHAELVREGGVLTVRDLGSRNGVRVNGTPVEAAELEDGDRVECGSLRLEVQGLDAASPEEELEASGFSLLPDAPARGLCLRVVRGGPAQLFLLSGERRVLGSSPEADLVLHGKGISRAHAELRQHDEEWTVRDLGARNGLFVNGQRVLEHVLAEGDELEVGVLRLRFEPAPPPGLLESVVTRFGEQSRRRQLQVGAMALGLLLLGPALLLLRPGASEVAVAEESSSELDAGVAALCQGRWAEAAVELARVRRAASLDGRSAVAARADALQALAAHWEGQARGPLQFRWDKAEQLLERAVRQERQLPGAARSWLAEQRPQIAMNRAAYEQVALADQALLSLGTAAELPAALGACEAGLRACAEVDPRSALAGLAADRRTALRAAGLAALEAEAARRLASAEPDWDGLRRLLERGEELADEGAARARLKAGIELCLVNLGEAEQFRRAWELLQAGPAQRAEAERLLEAINPRARVHAQARKLLAGLRAGERLSQAGAAYAQGDDRLALERLDDVFAAGEEVPADVRTSAAELRRRCVEVKNGLELARSLASGGSLEEAEQELLRVLQLEGDPRNRYRVLAEQEVAHLLRQRREGLERALERGEAALREATGRNEPSVVEAAFARAREAFAEARGTRGATEADLQRPRRAVRAEVARLQGIATDVRTGQSERMRAHAAVCELLLEWLPGGDPERARAERALGEVQRELQRSERRGMTMSLAR